MIKKQTIKNNLLKFVITFIFCFVFAVACYDVLLFFGILPFFKFHKLYSYHLYYPMQFIAVPCFVFSVFTAIFADKFSSLTIAKQILFTVLMVFLTLLLSCHLGGMLWHFHDMRAGYFPNFWFWRMVKLGITESFPIGWIVILASVPYNIIGLFASFFIIKLISQISQKLKKSGKNE